MLSLYRLAAVGFSVLMLGVHARLLRAVASPGDSVALAEEVAPSLRFLEASLEDGAGGRMQEIFPEGHIFSWALAGLSAAELARRLPAGHPDRKRAIALARRAVSAVDSPEGRAPFSQELEPAYGPFYVGWLVQLRTATLRAQEPVDRNPAELRALLDACEDIAGAYDHSQNPFLPSYPLQAWPVDSVVAVAGLSGCEALADSWAMERLGVEAVDYSATRQRWLAAAKTRVDPATGLLAHTADSGTGAPTSPPRATSLTVALRFLDEIDADWATEQYAGLRGRFLVRRLGVPAFVEFESGGGVGDEDSGPLVAGVSLSASAVGAGVARQRGDEALASAMLAFGDVAGLTLQWGDQRFHLLGVLPVADAFSVWAQTAPPPTGPRAEDPVDVAGWRSGLQLLTVVLLVLAWAPELWFRWKGPRW